MFFSAFSFLSFFVVKEIASNKNSDQYSSKQRGKCPFEPCRKPAIRSALLDFNSKWKNTFKISAKGFCFECKRVGSHWRCNTIDNKTCRMILLSVEFNVWFCNSNPCFCIFNKHMIFIGDFPWILDIDRNHSRVFLAEHIRRISFWSKSDSHWFV